MRLLLLTLSLVVCAAVCAAGAGAAPYSVSACFGAENGSWAPATPSAYVGAAVSCPAGVVDGVGRASGEGLLVYATPGRGSVPVGVSGSLVFEAPAGLAISGVEFDARLSRNQGWQAGVLDGDRWLWCGPACTTSGGAWVHVARSGLAARRLSVLVRCVAARCPRSRGGWSAWVALRNVRVALEDGAPPVMSALRGVPAGWARGRLAIGLDASDASGIGLVRAEVDGRVVHTAAQRCDFTRVVPCGSFDGAVGLDTRDWSDGAHRLRIVVADAAGSVSWRDAVVRTDNTQPGEPAVTVDGGAGWGAAAGRVLRAVDAGPQAAPLTRARVRLCRGAACRELVSGVGAGSSVGVRAFAGPGEYTARVALEDAAGNAGPWSLPSTFRFDDAAPGAPDLSGADGWLRGPSLPLRAAAGVSGLRGFRVAIGSASRDVAGALPLAGLPEGLTPIEVRAVSGAGVASTAVRTVLRIDRSAPAIAVAGAPAPEAWSREPVRLVLRGTDQAALSGVASLRWRVDGAGAAPARGADAATGDDSEPSTAGSDAATDDDSELSAAGSDAATNDDSELSAAGSEAVVTVDTDGRHEIVARAVDGAGNSSAAKTVSVRVDRTPPETVALEARDPADPRRVRAVVADAVSGVARGVIELRRAGGAWQPLDTTLADGRLTARIDDAVLPAGAYELRARAFDAAGNEAVGTAAVDGSPATVTLPVRGIVSLAAHRAGRQLDLDLSAGGRALPDRPIALVQRLRGRAMWRPVCPRRTVILAAARTVGSASSPGADTLGGPTRPTASPASAEAAAVGCAARTDAAGHVRIWLPAGPSRTIRATFPGDDLLLPATARTVIRTRAQLRLAAPAVARPGRAVRFRGRLTGGHLPRGGKVVELQARVGRRWRTFASLRTGRAGRVRRIHRFTPASSGRTYHFRLLARRESAYPFETGWSRVVAVRVL